MTDAKVDAYMRLYVSDWLVATADLSLEEQGAYCRLLCQMWKRDGWLLLDHEALARMLAIPRKRWALLWERLERFFVVDAEARLFTQKRLQEELEKARRGRQRQAESGRRGAETRWGRHGNPIGETMASLSENDGNPNGNPNGESMTSYPSSVIRHPSEEDPESIPKTEYFPETRSASSGTAPTGPPVLFFPTDGKSRSWALTATHVAKLQEAFSSLDVEAEARKALAWLDANPDRRKTARGMSRFLYGWMERAQNGHGERRNGSSGRRVTDGPQLSARTQQTVDAVREFVQSHGGAS